MKSVTRATRIIDRRASKQNRVPAAGRGQILHARNDRPSSGSRREPTSPRVAGRSFKSGGAARAFFAAAPLFVLAACGGSDALPTDGGANYPRDVKFDGQHVCCVDVVPRQPDAPIDVPHACCDVVPSQPDAPTPDGGPWYVDGPKLDVGPPRQPDGPAPIDVHSSWVDGRDLYACWQAPFYTSPGCSDVRPKMACTSTDGGSSSAMLLYCGCSGKTGTFSVIDGTLGAFEAYQFEGCCPGSIVTSSFGTYLCTRVMDGGSLDVFPADVPVPDGPAMPIDAPAGAIDGGMGAVDGGPVP
jgi:hypothetical protein